MAIGLATGCHAPGPAPTRAFYYWRTVFNPTEAELGFLAAHDVHRLYLRAFDVAWDAVKDEAVPVARCSFGQPVPAGVDLVPVVFLKNDVFLHNAPAAQLAERVWALAAATAMEGGGTFAELQTDCDWTDRSRDAYFAYCSKLRELASSSGVKVSATIRLHQVKYRHRTGVPPVDRGMLMFYNMGRLDEAGAKSAIYNTGDAERYVRSLDEYPLPMDAALPIFGWGVHWRDGRVINLMAKLDPQQLADLPAMKAVSSSTFVAERAVFFDGNYMQQGDSITIDVVTPTIAREASDLLMAHLHPRGPFVVALFDLDERNLSDYAPNDINYLFAGRR